MNFSHSQKGNGKALHSKMKFALKQSGNIQVAAHSKADDNYKINERKTLPRRQSKSEKRDENAQAITN